jgi:hypothetical protein
VNQSPRAGVWRRQGAGSAGDRSIRRATTTALATCGCLRRTEPNSAICFKLYFNGGPWDGNQLIPTAYVAAATSPKGWCRVLDGRD